MRISFNKKIGKFLVIPDPSKWSEQEDCRVIPNRKYDKTSKMWVAGPTKANAKFLSRWFNSMDAEAQDMVRQIEGGLAVKKTALPKSFSFKTNPRPHQLEPLLRMNGLDEYSLAMDPGTGKSKVLIDDAVCSFMNKKINSVLVICPNSIKGNWEDEINIHGVGDHEVFVYEPESRAKLEKALSKPTREGVLRWLIMGVESFSQGSADKFAEKYLLLHRSVLCLDESHKIKTHDSIRTKKILSLGKMAQRRRIATGTMMSKGVFQAWSQYEFLNSNILDMGYFSFRNHFCIMGGFKGKQIVGTMHEDEFIDLIAPYTFRASKSECLKDLPPKVYQTRRVKPNPEQERFYQDLVKTGMAEGEDGFVSFNNTLVRDLRLQQISGGFVALSEPFDFENNNFETMEQIEEFLKKRAKVPCTAIPGTNPKIQEVLSICDDTPGKIIFWSRFKPEIEGITQALVEEYGERAVVQFHGDVNDEDRNEARRRFQNDPECLYFVGQEATGGVGITLTAAQTMVYFSNDWSLENRIQSEDRFHRIGQKADSVLIIDIVIDDGKKPWVDNKIVQALKQGKSYTEAVMERIRLATGGM